MEHRRGVETEAQVELMTLTRAGLALLMTHEDVADVISHTYASEARGIVNDPHERRGEGDGRSPGPVPGRRKKTKKTLRRATRPSRSRLR